MKKILLINLLLLSACAGPTLPNPQARSLPPVPSQITQDTGPLQTFQEPKN